MRALVKRGKKRKPNAKRKPKSDLPGTNIKRISSEKKLCSTLFQNFSNSHTKIKSIEALQVARVLQPWHDKPYDEQLRLKQRTFRDILKVYIILKYIYICVIV